MSLRIIVKHKVCCFIRMSMNNLKDIHNYWHLLWGRTECCFIRMSMNNLKDIHNPCAKGVQPQPVVLSGCQWTIWRIYTTIMTNSKDWGLLFYQDVNEQFEGYTQHPDIHIKGGNSCFIRMSMNNLKDIHNVQALGHWGGSVVLSGCQWTIWRIYTTVSFSGDRFLRLFYQDVNEQFEGYTQLQDIVPSMDLSCFIRMSMNNLKDIHNPRTSLSVW